MFKVRRSAPRSGGRCQWNTALPGPRSTLAAEREDPIPHRAGPVSQPDPEDGQGEDSIAGVAFEKEAEIQWMGEELAAELGDDHWPGAGDLAGEVGEIFRDQSGGVRQLFVIVSGPHLGHPAFAADRLE